MITKRFIYYNGNLIPKKIEKGTQNNLIIQIKIIITNFIIFKKYK